MFLLVRVLVFFGVDWRGDFFAAVSHHRPTALQAACTAGIEMDGVRRTGLFWRVGCAADFVSVGVVWPFQCRALNVQLPTSTLLVDFYERSNHLCIGLESTCWVMGRCVRYCHCAGSRCSAGQ